jgi:3-dehydroquinate dehydratase-2
VLPAPPSRNWQIREPAAIPFSSERPEPQPARLRARPETTGAGDARRREALCAETAERSGLAIDFRQTNGEGELITWVQECRGRAAGIVINPAGYSHTSVALMDALAAVELPVVEVHISNIHRREQFRHLSYVSKVATGVICGLGIQGYALALTAMAELLAEREEA